MDVLITGGAGFIGSHLTRALLERGHYVVVLDSLHPQVHAGSPVALPKQAELIVADVRDRHKLTQAVTRVQAIYHLASLTGVGQSMYQVAQYVDVNAGGTSVLLDILANGSHCVKRLIVASSRAVYGEGSYRCASCGPVLCGERDPVRLAAGLFDPVCAHCGRVLQPEPTPETYARTPRSVYAATKLAQEHLARAIGTAYGIEVVILRYFNVYGPGQSLANPYTGILSIFLSQLRAGKRIEVYEDGQESRDFVHVSDAVQASVLALEHPQAAGQTFNVASGQATTVLQIAQRVARGMNQAAQVEVSGRFRAGDIRHCRADISTARSVLGYRPRISLDAGLTDFLVWASGEHSADRSAEAESELLSRNLLLGVRR